MATGTAELSTLDLASQTVDSQRPNKAAPKSRAFWMSFVAMMASTFLSALDLTAVGTALPTIAKELHDIKGDYIWIGSAYALSSTAFISLNGNLADVKAVMLISAASFSVGSALAGGAQNMSMMIAARGIGGGGILTLSEIITADLVPLAERGLYQGLLGMVWALASVNLRAAKRSYLDLNLPVGAIAFVLVFVFLSVKRPEAPCARNWQKGTAIVITGTGLANIGLTWGGIRYPWASAQVLAPLIAKIAVSPAIPHDIVSNRTSLSALLTTVTHGIITIGIPGFSKLASVRHLRSAVYFLPAAVTTTPFGFLAMLCVTYIKKYRLVNSAAWAVSIIGFGLFSTVREDTSTGQWVGYQILCALGIGPLKFGAPLFPLLASLPTNRAASALALSSFTRSFAQTWGLTISATIPQNSLKKNLPAAFVAQFPPGFAWIRNRLCRDSCHPSAGKAAAYRGASSFLEQHGGYLQMMIEITGLGLLLSFLMAELPMATTVDETYALVEKNQEADSVEMKDV
ncbi:iron permease [Mycena polygramma]|nr:iron permease [Mycena polygramma]